MSNEDFIFNNEHLFQEETNYSTRDQFGMINYFETFEKALESFLSYEGYRLSIIFEDKSVHFYRDELPELNKAKLGSIGYSNPEKRIEYTAKISVMK
jgi:hypothetical protein